MEIQGHFHNLPLLCPTKQKDGKSNVVCQIDFPLLLYKAKLIVLESVMMRIQKGRRMVKITVKTILNYRHRDRPGSNITGKAQGQKSGENYRRGARPVSNLNEKAQGQN